MSVTQSCRLNSAWVRLRTKVPLNPAGGSIRNSCGGFEPPGARREAGVGSEANGRSGCDVGKTCERDPWDSEVGFGANGLRGECTEGECGGEDVGDEAGLLNGKPAGDSRRVSCAPSSKDPKRHARIFGAFVGGRANGEYGREHVRGAGVRMVEGVTRRKQPRACCYTCTARPVGDLGDGDRCHSISGAYPNSVQPRCDAHAGLPAPQSRG
jgi:hypothetical protein